MGDRGGSQASGRSSTYAAPWKSSSRNVGSGIARLPSCTGSPLPRFTAYVISGALQQAVLTLPIPLSMGFSGGVWKIWIAGSRNARPEDDWKRMRLQPLVRSRSSGCREARGAGQGEVAAGYEGIGRPVPRLRFASRADDRARVMERSAEGRTAIVRSSRPGASPWRQRTSLLRSEPIPFCQAGDRGPGGGVRLFPDRAVLGYSSRLRLRIS